METSLSPARLGCHLQTISAKFCLVIVFPPRAAGISGSLIAGHMTGDLAMSHGLLLPKRNPTYRKRAEKTKGKMKTGRKPPKFRSAVRALLPPGAPGLGIPGFWERFQSPAQDGPSLPCGDGARASVPGPLGAQQQQQQHRHEGQDLSRPVSVATCLLVHKGLLVWHDVRGQLGLRARGERSFIWVLLGENLGKLLFLPSGQ